MKILIIRFSSIGDIVLTSPVMRCAKNQLNAEVHYLSKPAFKSLLEANPHIDKVHVLQEDINASISELKKENFDVIIDLHHNLRSWRIKKALNRKAFSFPKLNLEKWLLVNFKINRLPKEHIVQRYLSCLEPLGVTDDLAGLDFFIPTKDQVSIEERFNFAANQYVAIAIGAQHATKRMPFGKLVSLCNSLPFPIILLGGKEDRETAESLIAASSNQQIQHGCGLLNIQQSASVLQQARLVISHDTGLMHIASALQKKVIAIWGNTIPEFGMYPYKTEFWSSQVEGLSCRPCSKIGFSGCPKNHFQCMQLQNIDRMVNKSIELYQA